MYSKMFSQLVLPLVTIGSFVLPASLLAQEEAPQTYLPSDVIPSVVAADGSSGTVRVGGMMQFWAIPMLGDDALVDNGDVANAEGFRLRRARLAISGDFPKYVSMNLTLDPLSSSNRVHDANIAYRPLDEIGLVFGSAKVPYSRMQMDSSSNLRFFDRPLGTGEVAIEHRLGVAMEGQFLDGAIGYVVGVYNASDDFSTGNQAEGLLYGGRLESAPMGRLAALTPDEFRLRFGGGAILEDSATVDTLAYSGDLHLEYKYVRLRGEYLKDIRTPDVAPVLPSSLKGEVERQSIVGELTSFVIADRLELAFRYETYDSNLDVEDWGDTEIFVGGINGYIYGQNLKMLLNYIYKNESGGATLDNDALLLSIGGAI